MGRKQLTGIPYAPIDVDILTDDDRIKILRIRYGSNGVLLWIYILTRIYKNGYYLPVTKDFYEIAASDVGVKPQLVEQVITYCMERSLLDSTVFHVAEVLTSSGIQRRWQKAIQSRVQKTPIEVDERIWLLNADETSNGVRGNYTHSENSSAKNTDSSAKNTDSSQKNDTRKKNKDKDISFFLSNAHAGEEKKDLLRLTKEETDDLTARLSLEEFEHYCEVVRKCEAEGKHFKKSHYQAILDMYAKDRRENAVRKKKSESGLKSFDVDDFFEAAINKPFKAEKEDT